MITRKKNRRVEHSLTLKANLWDSCFLKCTCGWEDKHGSPWPVRELVETCNQHIRGAEQREREIDGRRRRKP